MKRASIFFALAAIFLTSIMTASRAGTNAPLDTAYSLQDGDQLAVSVMNHDELRTTATVLPDGTITLPILGRVKAAGLTVDQLANEITTGLSPTYNQPQVSVIIESTNPFKVNVVGAVKSPGIYDYKKGWHVLDLLAACGGPAQDPSLSRAALWTEGGHASIDIDIAKLLSDANETDNPALSPGDCLIVNALDPDQAQVQVTGEVQHPGFFQASANGTPVLSLLTQAGGATEKGALSRVQLMHNGAVKTVDVHDMLKSLDSTKDAPLAVPGDTINVPENTNRVAVLGDVHTPGAYLIPDGEKLNVTQAVTLAGGLTDDANAKNSSLVHAGTQVATAETVDLLPYLLGNAKTATPDLKPGDVLFVPGRKHGRSGLEVLQALTPLTFIGALLK